jgi:hypothetical protein
MRTPTRIALVFLDGKGQRVEIDLLDDAWGLRGGLQRLATVRTTSQVMGDSGGQLLWSKGGAKMRGVSRLGAWGTVGSVGIRLGLGGLDNIRRRRFGGS